MPGCSTGLQPSSISFAAAISSCEKADCWEMACEVLGHYLESDATMEPVPFSAVIASCSRSGEWLVAIQVMEEMDANRVLKAVVLGLRKVDLKAL